MSGAAKVSVFVLACLAFRLLLSQTVINTTDLQKLLPSYRFRVNPNPANSYNINGNLLIEYEPCLPYGDQSWCARCETELAMHNRVSQSTAIFILVRVRNNRTYVQEYIQCVLPYALLYVVY